MMVKTERKKINYSVVAGINTVAIALVALALFLFINLLFPFKRNELFDMQATFVITSTLSLFMLILSIYLIFTYLKDYLELKSPFTLGILLMIISFMLFALSSMPFIHNFFGVLGRPGLFSIIPYI